jgi:hypothetical protein
MGNGAGVLPFQLQDAYNELQHTCWVPVSDLGLLPDRWLDSVSVGKGCTSMTRGPLVGVGEGVVAAGVAVIGDGVAVVPVGSIQSTPVKAVLVQSQTN